MLNKQLNNSQRFVDETVINGLKMILLETLSRSQVTFHARRLSYSLESSFCTKLVPLELILRFAAENFGPIDFLDNFWKFIKFLDFEWKVFVWCSQNWLQRL